MTDATTADVRSIPELFAAATDWSRDDGGGDWSAASALQRIGTREVLDRALTLLRAEDPRIRARGIDILGQLGSPERSFPEECLRAAVELLVQDPDPAVLRAAAIALGHLNDARGVGPLVRRADHADLRVRFAVAFALAGRAEPEAVATLICMTTDAEELVRDWATFGIGIAGTTDSIEVRRALKARLDDPDAATRYEAVQGLARLRDEYVVPILLAGLSEAPDDGAAISVAMLYLGLDSCEPPSTAELINRLRSDNA